jgi:ATP-dependent Lon protease
VGLDKYNIELTFPDDVVINIIDKYARESGVRSLEKKVQIILEKFILDFL